MLYGIAKGVSPRDIKSNPYLSVIHRVKRRDDAVEVFQRPFLVTTSRSMYNL